MRMTTPGFRLCIAAVVGGFAACFVGCSDVGGNFPGAGQDGAMGDGTLPEEASAEDDASDAASTVDSTVVAAQDSSSSPDDTGFTPDVESIQEETGSPQEAGEVALDGAQESGSPDTGTAQQDATIAEDAGGDASVVDAQGVGAVDAGGAEDVAVETGTHDAGSDAASEGADAGHDAGTGHDAATESGGGGLAPCTAAGQTGCVKCQGNETGTGANGGLCTPTEAALVQLDIAAGIAKTAGDDPDDGCYSCLFNAACLDDTAYTDKNHECGDPLTVGTAAECIATLSCILSTSCASAVVNACYCGTASLAGACSAPAPNATPNGACDSQIAAGNGFALNDGTDNIDNLTNSSFASGKADQIFQCALSNACNQCQPTP
jgi:hypothetical protein